MFLNEKKLSTFSTNALLKSVIFNSTHVLPQLRWKDIKFTSLMPSSWETEALVKLIVLISILINQVFILIAEPESKQFVSIYEKPGTLNLYS